MKLGDRNSPPPQKGSQISKVCDLRRLSLLIMKRGLSGIQGFRVEVTDVVETSLSMEDSEFTEQKREESKVWRFRNHPAPPVLHLLDH